MPEQIINDNADVPSLKKILSMVDEWLDQLNTKEREIIETRENYRVTRATIAKKLEEMIKEVSESIAPHTRPIFNVDYSVDAIKNFSEQEFIRSIDIEIQPDEFKDTPIYSAAITILRRLEQPLNKKQLGFLILQGGKEQESDDFAESVKNSLKKLTGDDDPFISINGWYFLREWDLSQWGLDKNGKKLAD